MSEGKLEEKEKKDFKGSFKKGGDLGPKYEKTVAYVQSFPEAVAKFVEDTKWIDSIREKWRVHGESTNKYQKKAISIQSMVICADRMRVLLKICQEQYGYEDVLQIVDPSFSPIEPSFTLHKNAKQYRTNIEEEIIKALKKVDEINKVVYRTPWNIGRFIEAMHKMCDMVRELHRYAITEARKYLELFRDAKLLIEPERKRVWYLLCYYDSFFEEILFGKKSHKRKNQDEDQGGPKSMS